MKAFTHTGIEKANDLVHEANVVMLKTWVNQIVFTWRWWIEISIMILPWVYSCRYLRKKTDTYRLVCACFFTMLAATYMDTIGMALHLWGYPTKEVPLVPPYLTWDLSVIPVITMIFLHYCQSISPIIKSLVLGILGSFIMQPFAVWVGLYIPYHWQHAYSFPLVIIIYQGANYFYYKFSFKWPNK
ncbi:CBO0543 family protein [Desulfosporosinus sp. FKB]|uniref:CBO0543 family protein n=1 Tax=Desulfosporosinus sp. FKB TaxID=1969835 RepID=UPI000B49F848|nr:CBO0543 family protein [Desulfosporosinus sp. FKB]